MNDNIDPKQIQYIEGPSPSGKLYVALYGKDRHTREALARRFRPLWGDSIIISKEIAMDFFYEITAPMRNDKHAG